MIRRALFTMPRVAKVVEIAGISKNSITHCVSNKGRVVSGIFSCHRTRGKRNVRKRKGRAAGTNARDLLRQK